MNCCSDGKCDFCFNTYPEPEVHEPRHDIGPCVVCNMPEDGQDEYYYATKAYAGLADEPNKAYSFSSNRTEPDMPTSAQSHYKELSPEPIEVIRAWGLDHDFYLGNVVKYVARHQKKNGLEDLQKAAVYLQWAIERLQAAQSPHKYDAVNYKTLRAKSQGHLMNDAQIDGPNLDVSGN